MSKPLENMKHERFCQAYVVTFNGTKAAMEAGYKKSACAMQAHTLLERPDIRKRLRELQRSFFKAKKLEREEVMRQLYYLCTREATEFQDCDGIVRVDDLRKLPKALRASIDGLYVKQIYDKFGDVIGQEIKITLSPKAKAVELAMKHFSLFAPEKVDINGQVEMRINWQEMFKSMRGETPEVEGLINELPEKKTQLISRGPKGHTTTTDIPQ